MAAFHVYVEGPVDRTPEGIQRLAIAISQKYGLPVPDLVKRMTAGRFRVKANIDAATADAYARALQEVGARVKVEEAQPTQPVPTVPAAAPPPKSGPIPAAARTAPPAAEQPHPKAPSMPGEKPSRGGYYSVSPPLSSRSAVPATGARSKPPSSPPREAHEKSNLMPPGRAKAPSAPPPPTSPIDLPAPRPVSSSLPPATTPRPAASSLPPHDTSRASNPGFQSGLSAAYSQEIPIAADLGAIGNESYSLSSLDGNDATAGPEGSFGPPPSPGMPASIGPKPESAVKFAPRSATAPAAGAKPAAPRDAPLDLFAPPDADEAEQQVNLAEETAPAPTRVKRPSTPPLGAPTPGTRKQPVSPGAAMGGTSAPEMPRSRFAAGIFLAIIIGFIPAHLIASMREGTAFKKIDDQIIATQAAADTPDMYATLDPFRDAQLARKESERRSIALTSLLIWGVVAAGLGYVWFRRIPWDRMPGA